VREESLHTWWFPEPNSSFCKYLIGKILPGLCGTVVFCGMDLSTVFMGCCPIIVGWTQMFQIGSILVSWCGPFLVSNGTVYQRISDTATQIVLLVQYWILLENICEQIQARYNFSNSTKRNFFKTADCYCPQFPVLGEQEVDCDIIFRRAGST
jgi:hypothetical protein